MGDEGNEKRARKGGVGEGRAVKERRKEEGDVDNGGEEEGK